MLAAGLAHLWHPFRRNKGACFDCRQSRLREPLDQLDFCRQWNRLLLVLQAITGAYFDQLDVGILALLGRATSRVARCRELAGGGDTARTATQ